MEENPTQGITGLSKDSHNFSCSLADAEYLISNSQWALCSPRLLTQLVKDFFNSSVNQIIS